MEDFKFLVKLSTLKKRAFYLQTIRKFFYDKNILELETPLLYEYPVTDVFIENFEINTKIGKRFLQTSPEYCLKRALSQYKIDVYQISKVFRDDEVGNNHHYEFTMIEWYRINFSYFDLMKEVYELFKLFNKNIEFIKITYQDVYKKYCNFCPFEINLSDLQNKVKILTNNIVGLNNPSRIDCLDLIFSFDIEPRLKNIPLIFIYDYPKEQGALAKCTIKNNLEIAQRFEVYSYGLEIANAYDELLDYKEQERRFKKDLSTRKDLRKKINLIDDKLLLSLKYGMPNCSGIALGFDRFFMALEKITNIKKATLI